MKKVRFIFMYTSYNGGGKVIKVFRNPVSGKHVSFTPNKHLKHLLPGAIYEFDSPTDTVDEGVLIHPNSIRFVGMYRDENQVREWTVQDRTFTTLSNSKKMESKYKKNNEFTKMMEPLKEIHQKLTWERKLAFEILILNELRKK